MLNVRRPDCRMHPVGQHAKSSFGKARMVYAAVLKRYEYLGFEFEPQSSSRYF